MKDLYDKLPEELQHEEDEDEGIAEDEYCDCQCNECS
jgi:hypothetical protein